jgi:hypothetical protein
VLQGSITYLVDFALGELQGHKNVTKIWDNCPPLNAFVAQFQDTAEIKGTEFGGGDFGNFRKTHEGRALLVILIIAYIRKFGQRSHSVHIPELKKAMRGHSEKVNWLQTRGWSLISLVLGFPAFRIVRNKYHQYQKAKFTVLNKICF